MRCGARLGLSSPRDYTPRHLAEQILARRSALEGERKQVTVLFADVKESQSLAERVDPETWHKILDGFFHELAAGVHRFEGTINQYTGDGIMALFGAPIAHEDHAQRACYTALDLRERLLRYARALKREHGLDFAVRMGLNSGEVVVGRIGDDLRMDYTAQGHVVGMAARMEQLAEAGAIYLSEETAALVSGYFSLEDLGRFKVKGANQPVRAFALQGVGPQRTRLDRSRSLGLSSFVGRAAEKAALEAALERSAAGEGQVVCIVGEAGVGKSRLCAELIEAARVRGIAVHEAHCPPHGKAVPFLPVLELLRGGFAIQESDPARLSREKIAGRLLLLDRRFDEVLPVVFDFLGVSDPTRPSARMDPEARDRHLRAFLRALVAAQAAREPSLLFFDDLHWIDPGSDELLTEIVGAVGGTSTLLLVNFRPEYDAAWTRDAAAQRIELSPLGSEEAAVLLRHLLGEDPTLAGIRARLCDRAAGNPFFLEELVRSLAESGALAGERGAYRLVREVDGSGIPVTVQAVLAARIDRLAETDKQVVQTAAVIGPDFREEILLRVAGIAAAELAASLERLCQGGFIERRALFPVAEYAFRHPLTQEVAHRSQLAEARSAVHGRVARALEEFEAGHLDEKAALIADHWGRAGDRARAAEWHARAARWLGAGDVPGAYRQWREARDLLLHLAGTDDVRRLRLEACIHLLAAGPRVGRGLGEIVQLRDEGRALAEQLGDKPSLVHLLCAFSSMRGMFESIVGAFEDLDGLERMIDVSAEPRLREEIQATRAILLLYSAPIPETLSLLEGLDSQSVPEAAHPHAAPSIRSDLCTTRGQALVLAGRLDEGERWLDHSIEYSIGRDLGEGAGRAHAFRSTAAFIRGDTALAVKHARAGVEIGERTGSRFAMGPAYNMLCQALIFEGSFREAVAAGEQAVHLSTKLTPRNFFGAVIRSRLSEARLGLGQVAEAIADAEAGLEIALQTGARLFELLSMRALAGALLESERPDLERIAGLLEGVRKLCGRLGARSFVPLIELTAASLARRRGDEAGRQRSLREALDGFRDIGASGWVRLLAPPAG